MTSASSRESWIDATKGLTIILVVLHHINSGLRQNVEIPYFLNAIFTVLMTVRMPLFFLVAGFFAAKSIEGPLGKFINSKIIHFGYFYIIWSIISITTRASLSKLTNNEIHYIDILYIFVNPTFTLWFIYALALAFTLARLTRRIAPEIQILLASMCAAFVVQNFADSDQILLKLARFYPIFLVGVYSSKWIRQTVQSSKWYFSLLLATIFILAAVVALRFDLLTTPPVYYGMAAVSAAAIMSTIYLARNSAVVNGLEFIGTRSLFIYLSHFLPAAGTRIVLQKLGLHDPILILAIAWPASVIFCILFYEAVVRTPARFIFVRPKWTEFRFSTKPKLVADNSSN